MGLGAEDVETVERQHPRDVAEQARPIVRDDGDPVGAGEHDRVACAHERQHLGRREEHPGRTRRPAAQPLTDPVDELGDQLRLPGAPCRWAGGQRVGLGQGGQQLEHERLARGLGDRLDGGVVGEVTPGGDVGQEEVVAHHRHQHLRVMAAEAHARRDALDELDADLRVVARVPLAEVVEQRADDEEVGALDPSGQVGGVGGRLPQVPVDGEAVVGVALRPAAHGRPLGEDLHQQAALIERLEARDRRVPFEQEGHEVVAGSRWPGVRERRGLGGEAVEAHPGDVAASPGRRRRGPEREHRVSAWGGRPRRGGPHRPGG